MPRRVRFYVGFIVLLAVASLVVMTRLAPIESGSYVEAVLWLSMVAVLAHLLVFMLPVGAGGSIAHLPFIAMALVSPNWLAVAAVFATMIVTEIYNRRSSLDPNALLKVFFNASQFALATSAGIAVYRLLGGVALLTFSSASLRTAGETTLLAYAGLATVFFLVNTLAVSGVVALAEERPPLQVWRRNTLSTLIFDVLASPIAYLLGWFYVRFGPMGALGLAVPMLGMRQLYRTNLQLARVNQELLELMVKAIEARDPYTSGHSRRVAHYSRIIARALGLAPQQIDRIGTAALLHDVGKIHEVFAPILRKPDRLTADEWAIMQTHPIKSADLVSTVSHLKDLVAPVRHHHENWDGTGYPDGLSGEGIPLASRIIIFADTIDAMTTDRPYRKAMGEPEVRAELEKCRGSQFDPSICDQLLGSAMFSLLFAPENRETTPARLRAVPLARAQRMAVGA